MQALWRVSFGTYDLQATKKSVLLGGDLMRIEIKNDITGNEI